MPRYAIFLGAGASASEGAPLQRDLFSSYFAAPTGHLSELAGDVAEFFRRVFAIDVRNTSSATELPTFEEVLGLIDLALARGEGLRGIALGNLDEYDLDLVGYRRRLVLVMADAIRQRTTSVPGLHQSLVKNLRHSNKLDDTAFFSTNYDTLVDSAIDDEAIEPDDRGQGLIVDYGFECLLRPPVIPNREHRRFALYKLHGSINWLYCPVCTDMVITRGPDIVARLLGESGSARCVRCDQNREAVIVPPTYYKDLSNVFLAAVWNNAARALRDISHIVVCGYSLPDADMHVKYLLKMAQINRAPSDDALRISLVNTPSGPNATAHGEERARYIRFFGGAVVQQTTMSFEDFVSDPERIVGGQRSSRGRTKRVR
jgi:NAD-dependent SIR2 family protein deacetylase